MNIKSIFSKQSAPVAAPTVQPTFKQRIGNFLSGTYNRIPAGTLPTLALLTTFGAAFGLYNHFRPVTDAIPYAYTAGLVSHLHTYSAFDSSGIRAKNAFDTVIGLVTSRPEASFAVANLSVFGVLFGVHARNEKIEHNMNQMDAAINQIKGATNALNNAPKASHRAILFAEASTALISYTNAQTILGKMRLSNGTKTAIAERDAELQTAQSAFDDNHSISLLQQAAMFTKNAPKPDRAIAAINVFARTITMRKLDATNERLVFKGPGERIGFIRTQVRIANERLEKINDIYSDFVKRFDTQKDKVDATIKQAKADVEQISATLKAAEQALKAKK